MNLQQFLSNGGFAKMMSTIIQAIFVIGIGVILAIEALNNQPFNPYLLSFLGLILGHQASVYAGVQSNSDLIQALSNPQISTPALPKPTTPPVPAQPSPQIVAPADPQATAKMPQIGVKPNG